MSVPLLALLSILKWFIVAMLPFGAGAYFLVTQEKKTAHFDEEESLWDAIVASDKHSAGTTWLAPSQSGLG